MQVFLAANLSPGIQETLNKCRFYLKALFLSDIVEAEGKTLLDEAWFGKPLNLLRTKSWPYQGKPPHSAWETWRMYLMQLLLHRGWRLKNPLGAWIHVDPEWPWYMSRDLKYLLKKRNDEWLSYPVLFRGPNCPEYSLEGSPTSTLEDPYIATVVE